MAYPAFRYAVWFSSFGETTAKSRIGYLYPGTRRVNKKIGSLMKHINVVVVRGEEWLRRLTWRVKPRAQRLNRGQIVEQLCDSNLRSQKFPWSQCGCLPDRSKRWNDLPVNVSNPTKDWRVSEAIRLINRTLSPLGYDCGLLAENVSGHATGSRIEVSLGSALGDPRQPDQMVFGHVSGTLNGTGFPGNFVRRNGVIDAVLYLHLDSGGVATDSRGAAVKARLEHVVHEFGHALGLGGHFEGFGSARAVVGPQFWAALATLYSNPPGTECTTLQVPELALDVAWLSQLFCR